MIIMTMSIAVMMNILSASVIADEMPIMRTMPIAVMTNIWTTITMPKAQASTATNPF